MPKREVGGKGTGGLVVRTGQSLKSKVSWLEPSGLGFRVQDLGFRIQDLGFRI